MTPEERAEIIATQYVEHNPYCDMGAHCPPHCPFKRAIAAIAQAIRDAVEDERELIAKNIDEYAKTLAIEGKFAAPEALWTTASAIRARSSK